MLGDFKIILSSADLLNKLFEEYNQSYFLVKYLKDSHLVVHLVIINIYDSNLSKVDRNTTIRCTTWLRVGRRAVMCVTRNLRKVILFSRRLE